MYRLVVFAAALAAAVAPVTGPPSGGDGVCRTDPLAPAVTPMVAFDTTPDATGKAARYGSMQYARGPIAPGEIALTFDDGPDPALHGRVLDILDRHCVKATFFFVGAWSAANPGLVRDTAARGHTIGTHSQTHPNNLRRLSWTHEVAQIDGGFDAAARALESAPADDQARLAPFFRFPGLNDSPAMLEHLGERKMAVFSADFGTNDWLGISADAILRRGLKEGAETHGGIVILHETKPHTVEALDELITSFERRGYRFVQLVPRPGAREQAFGAPGAPSPNTDSGEAAGGSR